MIASRGKTDLLLKRIVQFAAVAVFLACFVTGVLLGAMLWIVYAS